MRIKKFNELYESNGMNDYNFIDREEATNALIDGFCVAFGEKHRETFTNIGNRLVDLGMKNGEEWCHDIILSKNKLYRNIKYNDKKILEELKLFFTESEIKEFLKDNNYMGAPNAGAYMDGCDELSSIIDKRVKPKDATLITPAPFNYFKKFGLSSENRFKNVTLFSEAGLGLDEYNHDNMSYMKEEGELFYPIESIGRKFHHLGQILKKQEVLKEYIEKSKKITPETNYFICHFLVDIIYALSFGSVSDKIILDIQKETGAVEEFITHQQLHDKLKNIKFDIK